MKNYILPLMFAAALSAQAVSLTVQYTEDETHFRLLVEGHDINAPGGEFFIDNLSQGCCSGALDFNFPPINPFVPPDTLPANPIFFSPGHHVVDFSYQGFTLTEAYDVSLSLTRFGLQDVFPPEPTPPEETPDSGASAILFTISGIGLLAAHRCLTIGRV
jgi:hypothetical protein